MDQLRMTTLADLFSQRPEIHNFCVDAQPALVGTSIIHKFSFILHLGCSFYQVVERPISFDLNVFLIHRIIYVVGNVPVALHHNVSTPPRLKRRDHHPLCPTTGSRGVARLSLWTIAHTQGNRRRVK